MPNKKRSDEKPEKTHMRRRNLIIGRDSETLFSMSFLSVLLIHSICANGCGGEEGATATQEKVLSFSEARKWIYIPSRGKESNFPHLALCEALCRMKPAQKGGKLLSEASPTTCAWKGEICCRRERWINLMPFNIGYCLCCCCYLIKFWSFSRRMSLMARVFASARAQSHQVNKV